MPKRARRFNRETKLAVIQRMLAGENVTALSREMNILRKDLYKWRAGFLSGGPAALRDPGRPRRVISGEPQDKHPASSRTLIEKTHRRIAELEKKVRRQETELRSIREALQQVDVRRRRKEDGGA
jgi:transposase